MHNQLQPHLSKQEAYIKDTQHSQFNSSTIKIVLGSGMCIGQELSDFDPVDATKKIEFEILHQPV